MQSFHFRCDNVEKKVVFCAPEQLQYIQGNSRQRCISHSSTFTLSHKEHVLPGSQQLQWFPNIVGVGFLSESKWLCLNVRPPSWDWQPNIHTGRMDAWKGLLSMYWKCCKDFAKASLYQMEQSNILNLSNNCSLHTLNTLPWNHSRDWSSKQLLQTGKGTRVLPPLVQCSNRMSKRERTAKECQSPYSEWRTINTNLKHSPSAISVSGSRPSKKQHLFQVS